MADREEASGTEGRFAGDRPALATQFQVGTAMKSTNLFCGVVLVMAMSTGSWMAAQVPTVVPPIVAGAKPVIVEHNKIHGTALEGDAVDRDVIVFLPPGYKKDKHRHYPVVYALHGFSIGAEQWTHEIQVPQTIEGAFALGAKDMIVVLPDSKTVHNGSMYSSSVTTGDFEKFISHDVVTYIDAHYRTTPNRVSRGLVGHSMGGYGASRIGMKHPDVFGSLYIMSPCCMSARPAGPVNPEVEKTLEAVKTPEDSAKLPFFARAQLASAAAWSPDPKNPPLYLDLPMKDGVSQPDILAKWAANAPLAFVDQYIGNLKQYRAIAMDVGDQDGLPVDAGKLHEVLDKYGIANSFEIYPGTHTSAVADRFQNHVLPFFSKNLCFQAKCQETVRPAVLRSLSGIQRWMPEGNGNREKPEGSMRTRVALSAAVALSLGSTIATAEPVSKYEFRMFICSVNPREEKES